MIALNFGTVAGLTGPEQKALDELVRVYSLHQAGNAEKEKYYEGHVALKDVNLGIALPQGIRNLLYIRIRIAFTGEGYPAVTADLKRIERIVQPVLLYGTKGIVIVGGQQVDAPTVLIVAAEQVQHRLHPAIGVIAAAKEGVLRILIVDILAVLLA